MSEEEAINWNAQAISTGSLALDIALGVGGLPRGCVVEIYGPDGSGKTTLAQHVIAEAQRAGGAAAFIDVEHALAPAYAARCGVIVEQLLVSQPGTAEQALNIVETLLRSGAVDVIVVDSAAALAPQAEIDGPMGDAYLGLQARLLSQALRRLNMAVKQSNNVLIFTNQLRAKIGAPFLRTETTSGGRALKLYASVRLEIRQVAAIKERGRIVGHRTRVRVTKNRAAPPFRLAEFDLMHDEGISRACELLDLGINLGVIDKRGSDYYFDDRNLAKGREKARQFLRQNPEIADRLTRRIKRRIKRETDGK
jgi:recombination protein RecA